MAAGDIDRFPALCGLLELEVNALRLGPNFHRHDVQRCQSSGDSFAFVERADVVFDAIIPSLTLADGTKARSIGVSDRAGVVSAVATSLMVALPTDHHDAPDPPVRSAAWHCPIGGRDQDRSGLSRFPTCWLWLRRLFLIRPERPPLRQVARITTTSRVFSGQRPRHRPAVRICMKDSLPRSRASRWRN